MPPKKSGEGIGWEKGRRRSRSLSPAAVAESEETHHTTELQPETVAGRAKIEVLDSGEDTDVASVASASLKNKRMMTDLSPEEELMMVEWLEAHPIIYSKRMALYKDTDRKERLWTEKAAEMGKSVVVLKTWYTSLRSRFGRLKKKRSGNEDAEMTERDEWVVSHFDFLRPHVHEVHRRTTASMKQKLEATCVASAFAEDPPSSTPTPRSQKQVSMAEEALLSGFEESSHQMMALQKQVLDRLRPNTDRERDAFVEWVRSVIHELDHGVWRRCQQEISNTLYRYIGENDQLKKQQVPIAPNPSTSSHLY